MGLMARGQAGLIRRQQKAAAPAGPVLYQRLSGGEPIDLTGKAWPGGRTRFARDARDGGPAFVYSDRDYMIPAAELVAGGAPFRPERGDRITETIAGVARVFEVGAPKGAKEFHPSDSDETLLRVHTTEQGC